MKFITVYVKVNTENNTELYERLTQWYVKHGYVTYKDTKKHVTHVFTGNSLMVYGPKNFWPRNCETRYAPRKPPLKPQ